MTHESRLNKTETDVGVALTDLRSSKHVLLRPDLIPGIYSRTQFCLCLPVCLLSKIESDNYQKRHITIISTGEKLTWVWLSPTWSWVVRFMSYWMKPNLIPRLFTAGHESAPKHLKALTITRRVEILYFICYRSRRKVLSSMSRIRLDSGPANISYTSVLSM